MQAAPPSLAGHRQSFAKAKDQSPAPQWDRGNLKQMRARIPKARRAEDLKKLSRIFNLAAKIPELRDALEWAKDHNIDFIVDHRAKAGGYYTVGTGVVAIVDDTFWNDGVAAGVLVHEIRHAWQDYYGMIPTTGKSFTDYYMRLAVIEADARAHQRLTECQFNHAQILDYWRSEGPSPTRTRLLDDYERRMTESASGELVWEEFTEWYKESASYYGDSAMKIFGHQLGIPGVEPNQLNAEYQPYKGRAEPMTEGIDVTQFDQLRRLGKGFKRGNYFNAASRELVAREFLAPGRAATLYHSAESEPPSRAQASLVNEIRRRELLLKRHKAQAGKP